MTRNLAAMCIVSLLLGACAGVPDRVPAPALDDAAPLAGLPHAAAAQWPDAAWWKRYHDPQLDRLMRQALTGSTSLKVAHSRVAEAQQAARVSAASNGVRIDGNAQLSRQRLSEHGLIPARFLGFTWYSQADLGAQLSYSFDWWGKHRASVEAALGQARAARASEAAAAIALQSAVAETYFAWQADQARLALANRTVTAQRKLRSIAAARAKAGVDPSDPVLEAEAALAAARQQRAQLLGMAAIHHASLAALLGTSPEALGTLDMHPLPKPDAGLPANAGIDLIARRPDVAASRWQVESALRQTDVARSDFLPDLSLSAMAGLSSIDLDKLFQASSRSFALTPALHLPIFEGGLLKARHGLSRAQLDSAIATYHDSVARAAREVATRTLAVQQLERLSGQQQQQLTATRQLAQRSDSRHRRGLTSLAPVLKTRLAVLQQSDSALELAARALSADIELIHALGGGYHSDTTSYPSVSSATRSKAHD